jgi:3-phenylpropionate/trans-cinnamate dioxygenase ferredoxin reductase component
VRIVIVGAGLAGASAAEELRSQGHSGDIVLIGAEPHAPYERPPLSKALLLGEAAPESVLVQKHSWWTEHDVELVTGAPVTGVDLDTRHVSIGSRRLSYDRLLLATGARPRQLRLAAQAGVETITLRTLDDAVALRARLTGSLLVVGAGWIGLEVAAAARTAEGTVTVVEAGPLPLRNVLGAELAHMFVDLHRENGVDLRVGTTLTGMERAGARTKVRLSDGTDLTPDTIVVGIGADPGDDLARQAGLATDHGVLVDAGLRASDPHVFAAGDVAHHDHPDLGRVRVEHWDTAIHQGQHAARGMLGHDEPYTRQPYFFTDQYDLGMEYVGHVGATGYDEVVVRGDPPGRVVTALWIRGGRVVAGMHVNDWDAIDSIRSAVGTEATALIRDPAIPLHRAVAQEDELTRGEAL